MGTGQAGDFGDGDERPRRDQLRPVSRRGPAGPGGAESGQPEVAAPRLGALIPLVGARYNFAYTPEREWAWTAARGWLEVLPGVLALAGGLMLVVSAAMTGGWLAVLAGSWFVVGNTFSTVLMSARDAANRPVDTSPDAITDVVPARSAESGRRGLFRRRRRSGSSEAG